LFGQADPDVAAQLDVILPEMENAVQKLRENMDQIQRRIDETLMRLKRSVFLSHPMHVFLTFLDRVSGEMSDLKYGTTDQRVAKELKVSY
jgi:hypothetical protein